MYGKKETPRSHDSTIQEVMPFVLLEIFPNQLLFVKAVDVAMMFQPSNKGPNKRWSPPHDEESLCITWKTTTHLSRSFWIKDPVTLIHKKGSCFFPPKHFFWVNKNAAKKPPPTSFTKKEIVDSSKIRWRQSGAVNERVGFRTPKTSNGEELPQKSRVGSSNLDDFSKISNTNYFKTTKH